MEQRNTTHHVVIFPLALQGPMNSTFKLAELLCLSGLHITFLVTDHIYTRLLQSADIETAMKRYPGFQIRSIPDGLTADQREERLFDVFDIVTSNLKPKFRDMLTSGSLCSEIHGPVSCIIADGFWGFTCDVAREVGVPIFSVRTVSPCSLWTFMRFPELVEAGEVPFQSNDLDEMIRSIPGMEGFLRRRDLPSYYRADNLEDPGFRVGQTDRRENPKADGLILNSFEELEESILPHMRTMCPNIYTLGPLHAHLKKRLATETASPPASTTSLWEEDRSCLEWLDQQPSKSVLYVSFGSVATLTKDNLLEFWHGLVNSGVRFLWVRRPDSVVGEHSENDIPEEVLKGTKERGYIVKWAPQEEVLRHEAVGGFLTHSGWNSTLESICAGVPMICWPFFSDQQVNSRFVSEVWRFGLDMKDTCERSVVEKMVKELMEVKKEEFGQRAKEMVGSVEKCLAEGGSSYHNLQRLVKDIDTMSRKV